MVKEFWKSVNICQSYGQLSTGLFFYEARCILYIVMYNTEQAQREEQNVRLYRWNKK